MKATGIIRRIDNLGRIVIPKEIRKNLRLKNGENMEIFINENENIILRKYSQIDKLKEFAKDIVDSISSITKNNVLITNTDIIIAANNKKKEYINKEISNQIIELINKRKEVDQDTNINLIDSKIEESNFALYPIIVSGDAIGSIIILSDDEITSQHTLLLKIISTFLAKYIEE